MTTYARDPDTNRIISATEAEKGKRYLCLHCERQSVHLRISIKGTPHFVRDDVAEHTSKLCIKKEASNTIVDIDKSDLLSLITKTMKPKSPGGDGGGGGGGSSGRGEERKKTISSLAEIHGEALHRFGPNFAVKDGVLKDHYIHFSWAKDVLSNPSFDGGMYIAYTRFTKAIDEKNTLVFRIYWSDNDSYHQALFALTFTSRKEYSDFKKKFIIKEETEKGAYRAKLKSAELDVIISGEWTFMATPCCKSLCNNDKYCKGCIGILLSACTSPAQIYIVKNKD